MNILFYRYNSICEPAFISAFKAAGINVIEDTHEISHKNTSGADLIKHISPILENNKILFVMSINFFPALSAICNIYKIPYVSLIVDCPVWELYSHEIQNPVNRIFIFDKMQWLKFQKYNPASIFHLPLSADINSYSATVVNASESQKNKYACDISFIGSLYTEKCDYDSNKPMDAYTKGFLDGIINTSTGLFGSNIIYESLNDKIVDTVYKTFDLYEFPELSFKDKKAVVADNVIGTKVSEEDRILVLKSLSEDFGYNVDLYTGSNTKRLPKVNNRGFAKTLTEMPIIFNQSKINLNITTKTIQTGISQRVFDVLACGGFLISNYQEELFDFFTPGKDLETFSSLDELHEKIEFYLNHDSARADIALNGYDTVAKFHSIENRIEQMISMI